MALNVFHRVDNVWPVNACGSNPSPCVRAWWSDIAAGLQHVFLRRADFNIAAVNLSIGDGANWTSQCAGSSLQPAIDNLRSVGIATVVAAGNDGFPHGLSPPACINGVVSVGAVNSADAVASFSNSSSYLSLLAPGVGIRSSIPGGGFGFMSGTSMATPHVAGAFALMKQAHPKAGVGAIVARLRQAGKPVFDPKGARSVPRLDVDRAIRFSSFNSDFTRDLLADFAVWRPSTGQWFVLGQSPTVWGEPGDVPVPGDYNGDGKHDLAVWRPSTGMWFVHNQFTQQWGVNGDVPVAADYNGDGKTDVAVWRPSDGTWYVLNQMTVQYGLPGDQPVPADYNGDGRADIAVWRPSDGNWHVRNQFVQQWGQWGDVATPRDVNGDGTAELVVFRPGLATWHAMTRMPVAGFVPYMTIQFGQNGDKPVGPPPTLLR